MTSFATREAVDPALELHAAAHSHHSCKLCGGGCRSYDIMLTEREARRLDMALWRPLLHDVSDDVPLVLLDETTHQYTLNKVADRCVFLDSDNLCIVHKSAGMAAKPIACQFFPLQVIQSPDGLHFSLNVGCRRLIEMTDADPPPDVEGARALLAQVQAVTTIGETLPLTPDQMISYAEFLDWQNRLIDILAVPESDWPAVWESVRAAAELLLTMPGAPPDPDPLALFRALHTHITHSPPVRHTLTALYGRSETWLNRLTLKRQSERTKSTKVDSEQPSSDSPSLLRLLHAPEIQPERGLGGEVNAQQPLFIATVARQSLEGQQAALHRTARTGWVALLAALIGGAYGAATRTDQPPDHALNEAISDAIDLFLSPAGQIALTEPNQQAFLLAVRDGLLP